jgi:hypothetical protein
MRLIFLYKLSENTCLLFLFPRPPISSVGMDITARFILYENIRMYDTCPDLMTPSLNESSEYGMSMYCGCDSRSSIPYHASCNTTIKDTERTESGD